MRLDDQYENTSVQDVIDRLMEIEDKSQPFNVCVIGADGFDLDIDAGEITELADRECDVAGVLLSIVLDKSADDAR